MVFISHDQDVSWSQKVCWKCIFQRSGDPNVKISPFTAHHEGTSGDTDLANSKETRCLRKNGCKQKCLDNNLLCAYYILYSIIIHGCGKQQKPYKENQARQKLMLSKIQISPEWTVKNIRAEWMFMPVLMMFCTEFTTDF